MKVGTHKNTHFDTQTSEKKSTRSMSVKENLHNTKFRAISDFAQAQLSKLPLTNLVTNFSSLDTRWT